MRRWTLLLLLLGLFAVPALGAEGWAVPDGTPPPSPVPAMDATPANPAHVIDASKRLTFKQRRALGLTFRNVRVKMTEMADAGELEGLSQSEMAAEVLNRIVADNPQAFRDPAIDWDALLEFLERLIPIILQLISLFS